jgi:putative endonuclease
VSEFSGALGEVYAARYLRDRGYNIDCANYRTRLGEIDITAQKDGVLAFIEVKTRGEGMIATPAESVDVRKQKRIALAAAQYLKSEPPGLRTRFDVIEVYLGKDDTLLDIRHIPNAFDSQIDSTI